MTTEELKWVQDFKIWNRFGKIEWPGRTNLLELNLDQDVHIKPMSVEVYPEDIYLLEKKKPNVGERLNKEALVTLYDAYPPEGLSIGKFKRKLQ